MLKETSSIHRGVYCTPAPRLNPVSGSSFGLPPATYDELLRTLNIGTARNAVRRAVRSLRFRRIIAAGVEGKVRYRDARIMECPEIGGLENVGVVGA